MIHHRLFATANILSRRNEARRMAAHFPSLPGLRHLTPLGKFLA
jgi:hypothetical protein